MEETTNLKPTIDALSLLLNQYIDGTDIHRLSLEKTQFFSKLESWFLNLKDPECDKSFVEICARLISAATNLDKLDRLPTTSLSKGLHKILAEKLLPEDWLRVRMFVVLEEYKEAEERKLNDDQITDAQHIVQTHPVQAITVVLTKYIYDTAAQAEEYKLVNTLTDLIDEYLNPLAPSLFSRTFDKARETVSQVGEKVRDKVSSVVTLPRSRPSTPVQGSEMTVVEKRDPLAPVGEVSDEIVKPKRNARKKKETLVAEIGMPEHEEKEQERLAKEAEAAAKKIAQEQAAKARLERKAELARQKEIEQQEQERLAKEAEAAAEKIAQEKAEKERAEKARVEKKQAEKARIEKERLEREAELTRQKIEQQERAKQAEEAELARQRAIEARKQEEAERRVKEIQDREAQAEQKEQELQTKKQRLVAAKNEKENIPQEIGALSNLIKGVQVSYSLATAQLIEQRRLENFWLWQRKAVESLEPHYVKDPQGQQKQLDAIIERGLYSVKLFQTFLFFGALFNLRKEKFTNHFRVCKEALSVQNALDSVAKGGKTNVTTAQVVAYVDSRLADGFDNALKTILLKRENIEGCRQRSDQLTQEIEALEAELPVHDVEQPVVPSQAPTPNNGSLPQLRSPTLVKI